MDTLTMGRKKNDLKPNEILAREIISQYKPQNVEDMQNALKDIFGPMFEAMLQGEMNSHLGYENNERGEKGSANQRNGYSRKKSTQQPEKLKSRFHVTGMQVLNQK